MRGVKIMAKMKTKHENNMLGLRNNNRVSDKAKNVCWYGHVLWKGKNNIVRRAKELTKEQKT